MWCVLCFKSFICYRAQVSYLTAQLLTIVQIHSWQTVLSDAEFVHFKCCTYPKSNPCNQICGLWLIRVQYHAIKMYMIIKTFSSTVNNDNTKLNLIKCSKEVRSLLQTLIYGIQSLSHCLVIKHPPKIQLNFKLKLEESQLFHQDQQSSVWTKLDNLKVYNNLLEKLQNLLFHLGE